MREEDPRQFVVANFRSLEEQLHDCMDYMPFIAQNQAVLSPKFVPIIMDSCSLIDSVLRDSMPGTERYTFRQYADMLDDRLDLTPTATLFLASPLHIVQPFQNWRTQVPGWWDSYNRIKHDRIRNYTTATFKTAVLALAALHEVLARSWQFLGILTCAGWFNEEADGFPELGLRDFVGCPPPELAVESKLFVSPIRGEFVTWEKGNPQIEPWDFSPRVKNYIWEWEAG